MASTTKQRPDDDGELHTIAAEQNREVMAAREMEADFDLAFDLQLQEAITASLCLQSSSSSSSAPHPPSQFPSSLSSNKESPSVVDLQTLELLKLEQELNDRALTQSEMQKARDDLHRRIHDRKVACDIFRMSNDEWEEYGDHFERPYGEGSSKNVDYELFRVYFKGLLSEERVKNGNRDSTATFAGIGVAICDSSDELIFEFRKPVAVAGETINHRVVAAKALIEGLNAANALDLERIVFYCDYYPLYQFVTGRWQPKQRKFAALLNQVISLQKKFTYCRPSLVTRNDMKFAFKLAREAVTSQINKPEGSSGTKIETCAICLEDTDASQIFSVDDCMHHYCIACMKQHVEVKLLHGMVPKCPHEGCTSELKIDSCRKFLTPKLIEMMSQRLKEAAIPVTEKIYCPYPKCSALMSRSEVLEYSKNAFDAASRSGLRKCMLCHGLFCINCKVPWHISMTCFEYKLKNPNPNAEDAKLKTLATMNLWRQCIKCNHMIELAAGCYHMTCRCGYEFCYTCGAEWKNKKAKCTCPLWDNENIIDDYDEYDDNNDDEDVFEEDYFDSDSDDYY